MDLPITFFCLCIFYVLLLTVQGYLPVFSGLLLAGVLLATSILAKQAGIFMVFPFVVASIIILSKVDKLSVNRKALWTAIVAACLVVAGPWYLYKEIQIRHGGSEEKSEVTWVTKDIYAGKSKMQRLRDASDRFYEHVTDVALINALPDQTRHADRALFFATLVGLSLLSLSTSYGRFMMLCMAVPYYLIWAIYFSYDLRNVTLLIPFWGCSIGIGSVVATNWLAARGRTFRRGALWSGVALLIVACAIRFPKQKLLSMERRVATERMMDAQMNRLLYQRYDSGMLKRKVLTGYLMMSYLPGLKGYAEPFTFNADHLDTLKTILEKGNYQFCILPDAAPPAVWDYFKTLESQGHIKSKIKTDPGWNLIELTANP
jgi:hypothetical protein